MQLSPTVIKFITISKRSKLKQHTGLHSLPQSIKHLSDKPKSALKNYLYSHSSYSVEENFTVNKE